MRARDLGIVIGTLPPGEHNAITDVPGVRVGHTTLISGDGPLVVGRGPIRTGVTVILPSEGDPGHEPLFAGSHTLNGNGEMTGLEWVRESGMLTSPIALTNTHSVGVVRDALVAARAQTAVGGKASIAWARSLRLRLGRSSRERMRSRRGMAVTAWACAFVSASRWESADAA